MKAIFHQHKNPLGINGTPVEVKQIIDQQCIVVLPNGKKTFLEVLHLKSFCGEITFTGPASADVIPDQEVLAPAEPMPATLFETPAEEPEAVAEEAKKGKGK
jgi:hypothetical protein